MCEPTYKSGLAATLAIIGGKWKLLILIQLFVSPSRFGSLRRAIEGISEKMLIQQLRELEADGVVSRHDFQEVPPKVEYALTEFGISLVEALKPLCAWGSANMERIAATKEEAAASTC